LAAAACSSQQLRNCSEAGIADSVDAVDFACQGLGMRNIDADTFAPQTEDSIVHMFAGKATSLSALGVGPVEGLAKAFLIDQGFFKAFLSFPLIQARLGKVAILNVAANAPKLARGC